MMKPVVVACLFAGFGLLSVPSTANAQDRQLEAKPRSAEIQKSGDLVLKRGLLAKEHNTVEEARILLKQMTTASHELTHVIQQRSGRDRATRQLQLMKQELDKTIEEWEQKLSSVGDDAQLANIELQNMMQKQQQTLQTLSNVSKTAHDTAMAIIRNIG